MINFFKEADEIVRKHEDQERKNGNGFNIFETLNLTTDEVRMSSLIAEFLNRNGSHKQSNKYLEQFLEMLYNKKNLVFVDERFTKEDIGKNPHVEIEQFHIIEGIASRIDIIIENDECAIVIENKIEAGDQDNQLWRYWQSKKNKKVMIVYLTKNGNKPVEDKKESNTLKSTNGGPSLKELQITCMSYSVDILEWLSKCLDTDIQPPTHIRVIMEHMRQNIRKITNQVDKKMERELVDLLLEDNNFKIAHEISKVVPLLRAEKTYDFFMAIKNELDKNQFGFESHPFKLENERVLWDWGRDKAEIVKNIILQYSQINGVVRLFFYEKKSGHLISIADGSYVGNSFIIGVKNINNYISYTEHKIVEILTQDKTKNFPYAKINNISCWNDGIYEIMNKDAFENKVQNITDFVIGVMKMLHDKNA